ncbi:MAG: glycosyltransferase family 2 protein [Acidobacteriia bacterium]|nr:glycosyltransferase family 2 protein [Terriglobia bacterium]
MRLAFLISASLILVAYAGYPLHAYARARWRPRPVGRAPVFPKVTIIVAAYNEEKDLPAKLRNLSELEYPADGLEIMVVSDGSTDRTGEILRGAQGSRIQAVLLADHQGKANAISQGAARAHGEILCFTDARQRIARDGLKSLVANFADPEVGCASGALVLAGADATGTSEGAGLYWRLEKQIRNWEGLAGSTVGATGAFYAVRKENFVAPPAGTILDDVYIPLHVARQGKRVIFDPAAVAWDSLAATPKQEFRRKVRTLTGNYQLLQLAPWLLTRSNPLRMQFVCHKLLRLAAPFALLGVLISTLTIREGIYEFLLALQLMLYAAAALPFTGVGAGALSRLSNTSRAFLLLNTAAAVAFVYFITGKKVVWAR